MKKLLTISALSLVLAACSGQNDRPQPPQHGGQGTQNTQLEAAFKECESSAGKTDRSAFEACMKAKGFEKPAGAPNGKAPNSSSN